MSKLDIKYDHNLVEDIDIEEYKELYKSGRNNNEPFTVILPPPNITGMLHLGHAWDVTLQDIVIRRKRMQGYDVFWVAGMDHAGIATQAKIDQKLRKQGISRYDIGREKFLEVANSWKDEYQQIIRNQWYKLGLSLDYTKEKFTLSKEMNDKVNKVFIDLYNDGLIYRGYRIINWDTEAKTALSNIEVEYKETNGYLYYIKYPLVDSKDYLVVATTRPETMFGDKAVMVNPNDDRYKKYHHKFVYIPNTNIKIPVITDEYVDINFGTGVVKVTPAHDPNDFEVGIRHNLESLIIMNEDGTMNNNCFNYTNLDRFECRKKLIEDLKGLNLVVKVEDYVNNVGYSERTGVVVEPRLSLQWFVKMKPLAKKALEENTVEFIPERFKKVYENWMNNIEDWCISRQLWWGHRIPCWYKDNEMKVQVESPGDSWRQDEDVLDTWFSSALWPFTTLGWPNDLKTFERYYPTNLLVTGYDIIFFWVSRMIFQAHKFTNKSPFKQVLIHGLIRDKEGRKMSKSLGNGVDPRDVINTYGADSLRYFITTNSSLGQDLRYDEDKVKSSWNFINKLWNIIRYVDLNTSNLDININYNNIKDIDRWIINKYNIMLDNVNYYYDKYEFNEVSRFLYNFIWDDFASWYLEFTKLENNLDTLKVLKFLSINILKLLHPFIPFVTEKLYSVITNSKYICISNWPTKIDIDTNNNIDTLIDVITKIRNIKNENKRSLSYELNYYVYTDSNFFDDYKIYIDKFIKPLNIYKNIEFNKEFVLINSNDIIIKIPSNELVDIKEELERLNKELERLSNEINRCNSLLNNPNFVNKAPKEKIDNEKEKLINYQNEYNIVKSNLDKLNKLR